MNFIYHIFFQLQFRVCDNGLPQRCANSTGTVTVTRNQFPPVFRSTPYSRVIAETTAIGTSILTVTATDQDRIGNIMYRVGTNSYPFELNSVTGVVSLQYDNLFYGPTQYQVRDLNPACQELLLKYFTVEERYQAVKVN